ncbi:hypothetical protein [Streptomyces massasporeus]
MNDSVRLRLRLRLRLRAGFARSSVAKARAEFSRMPDTTVGTA